MSLLIIRERDAKKRTNWYAVFNEAKIYLIK